MSLADPVTSPAIPIRASRRGMSRIEGEVRVHTADLVGKVADARIKARTVAIKIEEDVRRTAKDIKRQVSRFQDDAKFLKNWLDSPLKLGAVTPSSPFLAKRMAEAVDPSIPGPVIELGPGTGPVTEALLARGIAPERLVLIEFNPEFCTLLKARFPGATIIEGDAYAMDETLAGKLSGDLAEPAAAIVSSLPLTTRPVKARLEMLARAQRLMRPDAPFIQFTYSVSSPLPVKATGLVASKSDWVLRNIPPAQVWTYRQRIPA
ncbi:MAG: class I SAM-dependent methyltransferase [Bosea sp. (in: a-proteobacteria)]